MRSDTELANRTLTRHLLGASVESFGLTHQFLTLTFRDSRTDDHTLWLDTEITSNCLDFDSLQLDDTAKALLLFNRINLTSIIGVRCHDNATLEIHFDNRVSLIFSGLPADETAVEPWSIGIESSTGQYEGGYNVVASSGGGYAVFEGTATPNQE